MRVKIHGAGSIGNHLAHASRRLGWSVDMCDIDPAALTRARTGIYPQRYGVWDDAIRLFQSGEEPRGGYDLIAIGTPPDSHVALALSAIDEVPRGVLIEKPLSTPALENLDELNAKARAAKVALFVGYDHVVSKGVSRLSEMVAEHGQPLTLDVEFREHWQGIFNAHPWLSGPSASYLGFWKRGGGALGEHSHALNLWQHLALAAGAGRVVEIQATLDYVESDGAAYDRTAALHLRTERGLVGRVVQDVITMPTRKWCRLQYAKGHLEWQMDGGADVVVSSFGNEAVTARLSKTRPDDFIAELVHIERCFTAGTAQDSPISGVRGLDTMLAIAGAHRSAQTGATVAIDYDKGHRPTALSERR